MQINHALGVYFTTTTLSIFLVLYGNLIVGQDQNTSYFGPIKPVIVTYKILKKPWYFSARIKQSQ